MKRRMYTLISLLTMIMIVLTPFGAYADEAMPGSGNDTDAVTEYSAEDATTDMEKAENSDDVGSAVADELAEAENTEAKSGPVLSARGASNSIYATNVSPNGGKGSGTLNDTTRSKEYSLNVTSAGRLTITIDTKIDLDFHIYHGTSASHDDYQYETVYKGTQSLVYDLAPGKYSLLFERYSNSSSGYFSFTTSFVSANETYTKENDTVNAVRADSSIPFNSWINGQIAWTDRYDYYKVVLGSSGRLTLDVHNDTEEIEIYMYDSNEECVFSDYSMVRGDKSYIYDLTAGTYYLCFERDSYRTTGTYRFKVGFVPSGETYTADNDTVNAVRNSSPIPLAKLITGQLAVNDRYDYFKVSISVKTRYSINVNSKYSKVEVSLLDSNEYYVYDTSNASYHYHEKGSKTYTYDLNPGTYYLRFERYDSSNTGPYTFRVKVSVPKPAVKKIKKGKKSITVNWKKKSGVSGYEIQYGLKKSFANAKTITIKNKSATSRKISKLKRKKKYYVRVRSFKVLNGKRYYSSWSKRKAVVTK